MVESSSVWDCLEKSIAAWAAREAGIMGAVAVGSRTRQNPPADAWSDLDVMLFVQDVNSFTNRVDWIAEIGEPLLSIPGRTVNQDPERLVIFAGGYNVDFVFLAQGAIDWLAQNGTQVEPFGRGARVLVDKDGRLNTLFSTGQPAGKMPVNPPPTAEDFERGVLSFWFTAYYVAKMLRRGDLWTAHLVEIQLKETLASVLAIHAAVVRKREDAWFRGRFMNQWADPQDLAEIPNTFWRYNEDEAWRALLTTIQLFQRLSCETAGSLHYPYPQDTVQKMSALIHSLLPA